MVLESQSLWVHPVLEFVLVSRTTILLEIQQLTLAEDAHNLRRVDVDEYGMFLAVVRFVVQVQQDLVVVLAQGYLTLH